MQMTDFEQRCHDWLVHKLLEQGYKPYADLFKYYDLNLVDDSSIIAYMIPDKGTIVINQNLEEECLSTVVRHELMHQYLEHEKRLIAHLAEREGLDINEDNLDEASVKEVHRLVNGLKNKIYSDPAQIFNIAADYEISNVMYTKEDKDITRAIKLGDQVLSGLVTEDQHPEWVNMNEEEMYDALEAEVKAKEAESKTYYGIWLDDTTFIAPLDNIIFGI